MKTKLAYSALFLFVIATPAFSQQNFVKMEDDKNPCRRFKMTVLMPADTSTAVKGVRRPDDYIDAKMIWNPCTQSNVSFAAIPTMPASKSWNKFIFSGLGRLDRSRESPGAVPTSTGPSPLRFLREP